MRKDRDNKRIRNNVMEREEGKHRKKEKRNIKRRERGEGWKKRKRKETKGKNRGKIRSKRGIKKLE